jgi:cation diffusion facilitator CzcD-associated flavoprotein CzcO
MIVNQSKHTVSFNDLAWPESAPQFPKAWEVGQYLQNYIELYLGYEIRLNAAVVKTEIVGDKWKVQVQEQNSEGQPTEILDFDHIVIGTGFFGKPRVPSMTENLQVPTVHSSQVRQIKDLLQAGGQSFQRQGKRIVVVGGQMSGVEISASIANQLSSETHSIKNSGIPNIVDYYITNVVQRPFWVMPYFFPQNFDIEISSTEKVCRQSHCDSIV